MCVCVCVCVCVHRSRLPLDRPLVDLDTLEHTLEQQIRAVLTSEICGSDEATSDDNKKGVQTSDDKAVGGLTWDASLAHLLTPALDSYEFVSDTHTCTHAHTHTEGHIPQSVYIWRFYCLHACKHVTTHLRANALSRTVSRAKAMKLYRTCVCVCVTQEAVQGVLAPGQEDFQTAIKRDTPIGWEFKVRAHTHTYTHTHRHAYMHAPLRAEPVHTRA